MELSKPDKKAARLIIETGLQREFAQELAAVDTILHNWKNKKADNREAYHLVYQKITHFDKHLTTTYDRLTGSNYFYVMATQLSTGVISHSDIETLSPETRARLVAYVGLAEN